MDNYSFKKKIEFNDQRSLSKLFSFLDRELFDKFKTASF